MYSPPPPFGLGTRCCCASMYGNEGRQNVKVNLVKLCRHTIFYDTSQTSCIIFLFISFFIIIFVLNKKKKRIVII